MSKLGEDRSGPRTTHTSMLCRFRDRILIKRYLRLTSKTVSCVTWLPEATIMLLHHVASDRREDSWPILHTYIDLRYATHGEYSRDSTQHEWRSLSCFLTVVVELLFSFFSFFIRLERTWGEIGKCVAVMVNYSTIKSHSGITPYTWEIAEEGLYYQLPVMWGIPDSEFRLPAVFSRFVPLRVPLLLETQMVTVQH